MSSPDLQSYAVETARVDGEADRERMLSLWQEGLGPEHHSRRKFDWYYRRNPEGWPLVAFLLFGENREPAGVAATGTRRMRYGALDVRAGTMVDFVVRQAHRTLFPALLLQKEICREALQDHALLYGIPNPGSLAVIRRAGYRPVGAMVRRVRVLRSAPYLARYLPAIVGRLAGSLIDRLRLAAVGLRRLSAPGFRTRWIDRPDERFDDLWSRAAGGDTLMGVRDRQYLDWRFVEFPLRRHRFLTVVTEADDRLVAYAACASDEGHLEVNDFLVDPGWARASVRLWSELARAAYCEGHRSLGVGFLGCQADHRRLARAGLMARERQPVHAVLPAAFAELADESRWYLTNADADV